MYFDERCVLSPDATTQASVLFQDYVKWADAGNLYKLNSKQFGLAMAKKKNIEKKRAGAGYIYRGIGLLSTDPNDHKESVYSGRNHTHSHEAASQASSGSNTDSSSVGSVQSQQVFSKNYREESEKYQKQDATIHTVHTEDKGYSVKQPPEPHNNGVYGANDYTQTVHKDSEDKGYEEYTL
ncbi:hypothetical protein KSX_96560 [Ktedonospora formicarum]|nr:hypothetical protein KSX_96560 [Ktedonospora formicarum]